MIGFCFWNIKAFEVKVLLQKRSCAELEQNCITIKTAHGFIVSSHPVLSIGNEYNQKDCVISCCNQIITVNGNREHSPFYISPVLSLTDQTFLKKTVEDWFEKNRESIYENESSLQSFFNAFIEKKSEVSHKSYENVTVFMKDVFIQFFLNCIDQFGDCTPMISVQTLEQHIDLFLKMSMKKRFLSELMVRQLSKKEKKLLQDDQQFRFEFFSQHLFVVTQELLEQFVLLLPRNFLSQIIKKDVGCLTININKYVGVFSVVQESGNVYLVNCLDIDDYLFSVIHYEGWPGWPLEMNKVLAVICRTYLVWQVLQAQKIKRPYHIEDNIRHQSYKGHHKNDKLKQAIQETRDVCIAYKNKPILAMFDACCGGIVPARIDQVSYKSYPYLLRKTPCVYCRDCKIAKWKATFTHDTLLATIKKAFPQMAVIDDMEVTKKDAAELVKNVSIWSDGKCYNVTGKKIYSLFPEVKSFSFDIALSGKKTNINDRHSSKNKTKNPKKSKSDGNNNRFQKSFVISGKGYGHHMGLCQWGAASLVKEYDWNYQKVLQFYYPGTNLIKLTYQR